jgi:4-hydroxyacetophenone monooxygenase
MNRSKDDDRDATGAELKLDAQKAIEALRSANLNAVRMALYQATMDPELASMTLERRQLRGGSLQLSVLSRSDRERVVAKALAYFANGGPQRPETLTVERAAELLPIFGTPPRSQQSLRLAMEELGVQPDMNAQLDLRGVSLETLGAYSAIVIGAGVSGLAAGLQLKKLGINFSIVERQGGVGGTWFLNDYPEARVDISNFIYQYRFEQNYPWSNHYATQKEIRRYLDHIADKYQLRQFIQLNTTVTSARWNDSAGLWDLELTRPDGETKRASANFVISASGLFSTPNVPEIAGIESFAGKMFHSTAWKHDFDFGGRRVALVGAGSSGVQLMPWIAARAASLTVFQRTPNWITPLDDYRRPVNTAQQWLFDNLPGYWNWYCYAMYVVDKQSEVLQVEDTAWLAKGGEFNEQNDRLRAFLENNIQQKLASRPELIAKCTPSYPPLARRLVVDSGWYDALLRDNVELVTEPIASVAPEGIRTDDGILHQVDAIILGTGFQASNFLCSVNYAGRKGLSLRELWAKDGARAYLGILLPEFPNLFVFYGPNGQPQTGSFHDWADRWARFTVERILDVIANGARSIEVRREAFDVYNAEMDRAMSRMVWGRGAAFGYYINEHGRPITKMPWTADDFLARLCRTEPEAYEVD